MFPIPWWPLSAVARVLACVLLSVSAALCLVWAGPAQATPADARTESPYFFIENGDPATDRLPLKGTQVEVRIAGVIAEVTVTQHYRNEGQKPLEARYVFPGSTQAAVHAMQVRLGQRVLTARIEEKQRARDTYEAAKQGGQTAALLEQHRPNVFQMNVANILPGDEVQVELRYTELIAPDEGVYGFVFPTVVGPRYASSQAADPAGSRWAGVSSFAPGAKNKPPRFDLRVSLEAPLPLSDITSTTHDVDVQGQGSRQARVSLRPAGRIAQDRDFILRYRLAGEGLQSGLMLQAGGPGAPGGRGENFFLAMVEPPRAVSLREIVPRDYVFVVDVSGSMNGFPLQTAKALLRDLIGGLRASDTFNVMLFAGSSEMLAPASVPATRANIERAIATLEHTQAGGGTEIVPALRRIAELPKAPEVSRSVIVVTDGYVTVENEVFSLIAQHLNQQNLFAFGIGSSVNRHLIEGMARAGRGEAFVVTEASEAPAATARLRRMVEAPVLTQVRARIEGLQASEVFPVALPDVMGGRPVLLFGKWQGDPTNARVIVEGRTASGPYRAEVRPVAPASATNGALRQLWARHRIASLSDQEALDGDRAHQAEITALGLQYSLLTPYTSFIAVDELVRAASLPGGDAAETVDQPSPLPAGVPSSAVQSPLPTPGVTVPSTPEPPVWASMLVMLALLITAVQRSRRRFMT
jgi:Ca-activated chloride channel family protein